MTPAQLKTIASELLDGQIDVSQFVAQIASLSNPDSVATESGVVAAASAAISSASSLQPDAVVDLDRKRRCGFPEVVFGEGKSIDSIVAICEILLGHGEDVLVTRVDAEKAAQVRERLPHAVFNAESRTLRITQNDDPYVGSVAVVSAGTSDLPVAMEAAETLDWMRVKTDVIQDIGVAGPQRLQSRVDQLLHRDAIVVVAGMEGALPSVVAGHVDCPVIAVPTSVGYGANFGGISALLSMLNSCAANVAVVNIDAGFKGGYLAGMIARKSHSEQAET